MRSEASWLNPMYLVEGCLREKWAPSVEWRPCAAPISDRRPHDTSPERGCRHREASSKALSAPMGRRNHTTESSSQFSTRISVSHFRRRRIGCATGRFRRRGVGPNDRSKCLLCTTPCWPNLPQQDIPVWVYLDMVYKQRWAGISLRWGRRYDTFFSPFYETALFPGRRRLHGITVHTLRAAFKGNSRAEDLWDIKRHGSIYSWRATRAGRAG
jgi:hypothetical protein